jgi:hypothetical protein
MNTMQKPSHNNINEKLKCSSWMSILMMFVSS